MDCFASARNDDAARAGCRATLAHTGGLSIRDAVFAGIFRKRSFVAHVLGAVGLLAIAASRCT
jgi:hypothetical protein